MKRGKKEESYILEKKGAKVSDERNASCPHSRVKVSCKEEGGKYGGAGKKKKKKKGGE